MSRESNQNQSRWRRDRDASGDDSTNQAEAPGDRDDDRDESAGDQPRPPQACPEPSVDPLPAIADDELSGLPFALERAAIVYYRGCRAVASAVNRVKEIAAESDEPK